jgi:hypothetical protein
LSNLSHTRTLSIRQAMSFHSQLRESDCGNGINCTNISSFGMLLIIRMVVAFIWYLWHFFLFIQFRMTLLVQHNLARSTPLLHFLTWTRSVVSHCWITSKLWFIKSNGHRKQVISRRWQTASIHHVFYYGLCSLGAELQLLADPAESFDLDNPGTMSSPSLEEDDSWEHIQGFETLGKFSSMSLSQTDDELRANASDWNSLSSQLEHGP